MWHFSRKGDEASQIPDQCHVQENLNKLMKGKLIYEKID